MKRSPSGLLLCAVHGVASTLLWWAGEGLVEQGWRDPVA